MILCSKITKNIAENIPYSFYNEFLCPMCTLK